MAIYLKWYMCPCYDILVVQISICSNTSARVEYYGSNRNFHRCSMEPFCTIYKITSIHFADSYVYNVTIVHKVFPVKSKVIKCKYNLP